MPAIAKGIGKSIGRCISTSSNFVFGIPPGALFKAVMPYPTYVAGVNVLRSSTPSNAHPTVQQVKGSGFAGTGSAIVIGLLTTDIITATGDAPTCSVGGTLTFPGADCWDIYVHRAGELWAYWPGINVGGTLETDSSGNDHTLTDLTGTTITARTDGTGTDYVNETGYSVADGVLMFADLGATILLPVGARFIMGYEPEQVLLYADGGIDTITNDALENLYSLVI